MWNKKYLIQFGITYFIKLPLILPVIFVACLLNFIDVMIFSLLFKKEHKYWASKFFNWYFKVGIEDTKFIRETCDNG